MQKKYSLEEAKTIGIKELQEELDKEIENNEIKTWRVYISNMIKYSDIWYGDGRSMVTDKLSTEEEFDLLFEIITGEKVKLLKVPKPNPEIFLKKLY